MKKGILTDKEYDFIYSRSPRVCVDLVLLDYEGTPLLLKRQTSPYKGKYHLPGGRIRFRETIDKAIKRIAKNEIGENVIIGSQIGFMQFMRECQNGNKRHSVSLVFMVYMISKKRNTIHSNVHPVHLKFLKEKNIL